MEGRQSVEALGRTKGFPKSPPNQRRTTMTTKDLGPSCRLQKALIHLFCQRSRHTAAPLVESQADLLAYAAVTPIRYVGLVVPSLAGHSQ